MNSREIALALGSGVVGLMFLGILGASIAAHAVRDACRHIWE